MRRKKIFVRPHLNDRAGDISKRWYVELSMRNHLTNKMQRARFEFLDEIKINNSNSASERYEAAKEIIRRLNEKVESGWSIFTTTERFVYEDQLQYSHAAQVYKKNVSSNKNYSYYISRYIDEELSSRFLKSETLRNYKSRYRTFKLWLESKGLDTIDIVGIDNAIIIKFFEYLMKHRDASTRTYRSYSDLLFAFFEFWTKKGIIEKNPVYNLPVNRNIKDFGAERIHAANLNTLMQALDKDDPQLAMACRFEYYMGMRPGNEIRLLKVGDIDFQPGFGRVRVPIDTAKSRKRREIAIPDVFLEYLIKQGINQYDAKLYVFGCKGRPGIKHLGKNNMRFRFNTFREKLGLPYENKFYSMKHTGAVKLAEEGEKIINIRDHLGHTSIATTEAYLKRHGFSDSVIIRKHFPAI